MLAVLRRNARRAHRPDGKLPRFVIHAMVDNWEAAEQDRRPMCADTGLPRYYVKVGNDASVESGFTAVERAWRKATAEATHAVPLRPNRVHPLWRTDNNNNVGINSPEIEWSFEPDADPIDITTVHKGGLFGTACCFRAMASTASSASCSTR